MRRILGIIAICAVLVFAVSCIEVAVLAPSQPVGDMQDKAQTVALGEPLGPHSVDLPDKVGGVNFAKWTKRNPDMVGWIKIEGTNVDNVIMQSDDNDYYLHRDPDKKKYFPGTVFLDFRCDKWLNDYNTVLYGHHMADGSMFRDIARYIDPAYLKKHSKITYINHAGTHKLKPFYAWAARASADMNIVNFESVEQFQKYWKKRLKGEKLYNGVDLDEVDHIWSFYTCSYQGDDFRTVVLAAEF